MLRVVKITLVVAAGKVCSVRLPIRCLIKDEKESPIKGTQRNTVFLSGPKVVSLSPMGLDLLWDIDEIQTKLCPDEIPDPQCR